MSITLNEYTLNYKSNEYKYIITFVSEYDITLDTYLDRIFNYVFPLYESHLRYSIVCGNNAEYICKNLQKMMDNITNIGKIIIVNWIPKNTEIFNKIESVYGHIGISIGASYHALAYLEIGPYYVAIETTSCIPYKLQFYVANNKEEFTNIIKSRYQCIDFKVSFDCEKDWISISYSGGKKIKTKNKNKKNKKRKTKTKTRNKKNKKIKKFL